MKKLLSLALALVLVLSMSVTAFAESVGPTVTNGTQNVTGKYVAAAESDPIYKVDISWGSMAFTYTAASKGTWSTSSHTYEGAKPAAWSWADGANEIKVTNHSNAGITVTPKWNADSAYTAVSMTFDRNSLKLLTADNGTEDTLAQPTVGLITVTPKGDLPKDTNGKIGSITLKLGDEPMEVTSEEELLAAFSAGRSVKLADDFALTETVDVTKATILDLSGHVISNAKIRVQTGGDLTVLDSGNGGKLTANGGNILVNNGGNLTINSGTVEGSSYVVLLNSGNTVLNGGTFVATDTNGQCIVAAVGNLSGFAINGGTFQGAECSVYDPMYNLTIQGGTFEKPFNTPNSSVSITVVGGTYHFDPTAYLDATVAYVQDNDDGTYTVLKRDENTTVPINQTVKTQAQLTAVTKTGGTATMSTTYALEVNAPQALADGITMTLDLNGKKISATGAEPLFSVPTTATLTIKDGANSTNSGVHGAQTAISVDGTLYVQGGDITASTASVAVSGSGKATVSGGTLLTITTSGALTFSGGSVNVITLNAGKTEFSNGTVNGVITVNDGELQFTGGTSGAVTANAGIVTISGGSISNGINVTGTANVTITGGTFAASLYKEGDASTLTITGGTFSNDPSAYVDTEYYTVTTNEDGTYTVTKN